MADLLGAVEATVPPDDAQIFVVAGEPDDVPILDGTDGRFVGCAPDGDWDDVQSGRRPVSEASVAVGALWEMDTSERLPLRATGWHHVRVHAGGRAALRQWDANWDGDDVAPVGLERFVVQIWAEG